MAVLSFLMQKTVENGKGNNNTYRKKKQTYRNVLRNGNI